MHRCSAAGFLAISISLHTRYPSSWMSTLSIYAVGWSPIRSSSYCCTSITSRQCRATNTSAIRWTLVVIWVLAGAVISFACSLKKEAGTRRSVEGLHWVFNLYFLLAAPAVLERDSNLDARLRAAAPVLFPDFSVLFSFYMPLVPWTLQLPNEILFPVSIVHYLSLWDAWSSWPHGASVRQSGSHAEHQAGRPGPRNCHR